jgi:hypothetical protein
MKNIVRILSLTAALAFAAIPAAPVGPAPLGPCYYSCCSTNPFQCQSYSTTTTESQCCSGEMTCPAGTSVRAISWGNPRQKCTI